jgi:glycosyltransferase involved in cell wall biosynthesis
MTGTPQIEERSESDTDANWYTAEPGTWLPQMELDGAPLHRVRLPDGKGSERTRIYYDSLLEVCRQPCDAPVVAQLLTNIRPEAQPWLEKLKAAGIPTLYSVSQFPTWQQKPYKRFFRRRGYRSVYNTFDALVTNSETIKEFLRGIGVTTHIEYIPNGVNLSRFHPVSSEQERLQRESLRERLGIPLHHKVIIAVGAVMPRKGPDKVLGAWLHLLSRIPDTHVLFVGPRADKHDPKLQKFGAEITRIIARTGAAHQVHFAGIVDDVENYLRAADVFVLASNREGTPNSVLEAMATGLPCLVTPYIGLSEGIGRPGEHYLLVDREPEVMALALNDLLQNETVRSSIAANGRRFVVENIDQERSLDHYTALYETLAATRG